MSILFFSLIGLFFLGCVAWLLVLALSPKRNGTE